MIQTYFDIMDEEMEDGSFISDSKVEDGYIVDIWLNNEKGITFITRYPYDKYLQEVRNRDRLEAIENITSLLKWLDTNFNGEGIQIAQQYIDRKKDADCYTNNE